MVKGFGINCHKATFVAINHILHGDYVKVFNHIHNIVVQFDVMELFLLIFRDRLSHS